MEEKIKEIFKSVFELDNVDNSFAKNSCEKWDSMNHLNLIVELESGFNISIEPEDFDKLLDYKSVCSYVKSKK